MVGTAFPGEMSCVGAAGRGQLGRKATVRGQANQAFGNTVGIFGVDVEGARTAGLRKA